MDDYPPIEDHGLIGDLQTAALVSRDGSIDWFCCPRFDSPSVFASLLDKERGGFFRIAPASQDYTSRQLYFPDSAILITRFMTEGGVGEVVDFMPVIKSKQPTDRHQLVRLLRCVRGQVTFALEVVAAVRLRPAPARDPGDRARGGVHGRRAVADDARRSATPATSAWSRWSTSSTTTCAAG